MNTGATLLDELQIPSATVRERAPMDSSSVLLGLMHLARKAERDDAIDDPLSGIISRTVMRSLLSALQYRDSRTVQHCRRVATITAGVARHLGWEGRALKSLEVAALMHDIGKIGVPDNILLKPAKLSPDEAELMALHHNIGYDMLQACQVDRSVLEIIAQSHLPYSNDVNLGARILCVADAYDSLLTAQVYREAKTHAEAIAVLRESVGKQFDENVVNALDRCVVINGQPFESPDGLLSGPHHDFGPSFSRPEESFEANHLAHIFSYLYLLESLYDGFYIVNSDLRFLVWNRGAEKLLGNSPHDLLGQTWSRRLLTYADRHGEAIPDCDVPLNRVVATGLPISPPLRMQNAAGDWLDVEVQSVPLVDIEGRLQGVIEIFRDLSRSSCRPMEFRELRMAATRDALTSVANRGELETRLASLVKEAAGHPSREPCSIIFLDVDHFKRINDTYGHTSGDQVLIDVARLMQSEMYSGELVGRYGGEEFVILCPGTAMQDAIRRAERVRLALSRSPVGGVKDLVVTASFGVTQIEPGDSVESVLRRADKALYTAKGTGRNKTCSLTSREMLNLESQQNTKVEVAVDPFVHEQTFHACVAADLIIYKLGGFVNEQQATLVSVQPNHVVIRIGRRGLLPYWGSSDERRPVELSLKLSATTVMPGTKKTSLQVLISATVKPVGWVRDPELFQARAKRVVKQVRSYFVAE